MKKSKEAKEYRKNGIMHTVMFFLAVLMVCFSAWILLQAASGDLEKTEKVFENSTTQIYERTPISLDGPSFILGAGMAFFTTVGIKSFFGIKKYEYKYKKEIGEKIEPYED